VRLLLDTCAFLWLSAEPDRLSGPAREALDDPSNVLLLSDVTVWEIVLKHQVGKLPLPEPPRTWLPKQTAFFELQNANRLTSSHCFGVANCPPFTATRSIACSALRRSCMTARC